MKYLKTYEKFLLENISKGAEIQYNQEMKDIEDHDREIKNKKLFFLENNKWEIEIGEIDRPNMYLIFAKKYLSNINEEGVIPFYIYSSFLLIKSDNSNLMISYEQDFNAED